MTIGERIRDRRTELGMSQEELALKIGYKSRSSVNKIEKNERELTQSKIKAVADALKTTPAYIMGWNEAKLSAGAIQKYKPNKSMPVLGRIPAGLPLYAEENIEGYVANDFEDGHEYYALRVFGDSMTAAGIDDGDLVIVRRQDTVEDGQIAVVIINGYDATVKFFKQDGRLVILSPKSYNPEHNPQVYDIEKDAVRVLGRVVQIRKDR